MVNCDKYTPFDPSWEELSNYTDKIYDICHPSLSELSDSDLCELNNLILVTACGTFPRYYHAHREEQRTFVDRVIGQCKIIHAEKLAPYILGDICYHVNEIMKSDTIVVALCNHISYLDIEYYNGSGYDHDIKRLTWDYIHEKYPDVSMHTDMCMSGRLQEAVNKQYNKKLDECEKVEVINHSPEKVSEKEDNIKNVDGHILTIVWGILAIIGIGTVIGWVL